MLCITLSAFLDFSSPSTSLKCTADIGISLAGFAGGAYLALGFSKRRDPIAGRQVISATSTAQILNITMVGYVVIPTLGTPDTTFDVGLMTENSVNTPSITTLMSAPWSVIVCHYRPN